MESNNNINQQGIATFLRTVVDVSNDLALPYYLDENHRFSRTPQELEGVHLDLCDRSGSANFSPYTRQWTYSNDTAYQGLQQAVALPKDKLRYFCIQSRDNRFHFQTRLLSQILAIHKYPLFFPVHAETRKLWGEGAAISKGGPIELPAVHDDSFLYLPTLTKDDLDHAKMLWEMCKKFSEDIKLVAIFKKFTALLNFHGYCLTTSALSPLKIVAQFAVLEGILTHKPKAHIVTDSLTHQVCKKLLLLSGRPNVEMPQIDGERIDKTWKTLYNIRSNIVHGEAVETWSDEKLSQGALIHCMHSSDFIAATVRAVFRAMLFEPELVFALKEI